MNLVPIHPAAGPIGSELPPMGPTVEEELRPYMPVFAVRVAHAFTIGDYAAFRPDDCVLLSERKVPNVGDLVAVYCTNAPAPFLGRLSMSLPPFLRVTEDSTAIPAVIMVCSDGKERAFKMPERVCGVIAVVRPVL